MLDDNKTLWFFENVEDKSEGRIVPPIKDRIEIINKAHLLGHFRLEKTYRDVASKYWWKGMWKQCDHVIKKCITCLRFSSSPSFNHPALATKVTQINDKISIDIVLGFPETEEGF